MSKLFQNITGLQNRAKEQAEEVSSRLEEGRDPNQLISSLREQVKTVKTLQEFVNDLHRSKVGLTGPVLNKLKRTFKELADIVENNHKNATQKGIKLTPKARG